MIAGIAVNFVNLQYYCIPKTVFLFDLCCRRAERPAA
jgi:hypothetical protein